MITLRCSPLYLVGILIQYNTRRKWVTRKRRFVLRPIQGNIIAWYFLSSFALTFVKNTFVIKERTNGCYRDSDQNTHTDAFVEAKLRISNGFHALFIFLISCFQLKETSFMLSMYSFIYYTITLCNITQRKTLYIAWLC